VNRESLEIAVPLVGAFVTVVGVLISLRVAGRSDLERIVASSHFDFVTRVRVSARQPTTVGLFMPYRNGGGDFYLGIFGHEIEIGPLGPIRQIGNGLGMTFYLDARQIVVGRRTTLGLPGRPNAREETVLRTNTGRRVELSVRSLDLSQSALEAALRTAGASFV
jgi:hypothetical protein